MSFPRDLDEIGEDELQQELLRRFNARQQGVCDYCGRGPKTPSCKYSGRHSYSPPTGNKPPLSLDKVDPRDRLIRWFVQNPLELDYVVSFLRLPLPVCEGHDGPCTGPVLWHTPAMTQYEWDGVGADPNGPRSLCVRCSSSYQEDWEERWREYYSDRL